MRLRTAHVVAATVVTTLVSAVPGAAATTPGPVVTQGPTVSGIAQQGQRLTAASGTWTGSGTVAYAYQWYRCDPTGAHCASISGAKATGYKLGAKDAGQTIGLTVRATDTTGTTAAYASVVGPVAAAAATLRSTVQPAIVGTAVRGQTLTAGAGLWNTTPTATTFAWYRCNENGRICAPIDGAAAAIYVPVDADVGHALVALVHATAGTATQDAFSTRTAVVIVATGPIVKALPLVAGVAQQGQRLIATPGSWTGVGPVSLAYQWYRCDADGAHCGSISGARAIGYTIGAKDVAHTLGLAVRGTDTTGTLTVYASLVGPVAARSASIASTVQPKLTGTAAVGSTLTADKGTWNTTPSAYAYAWYRCNANGRLCVAIPTATQSTYTVTADDSGHTLVALVQANAASAKQSALSTTSAAVP